LHAALPAVEARLDRAQLIVLGTGDPALTEELAALERRRPGKARFWRAFDEPFAHRLYAATDVFLMPSRFEPCGLGQMIAMRYGAVPVVARTGGLIDTVTEKNGFLCAPGDGPDLGRALDRALDARRAPDWDARVGAAMAQDFSWDRSVEDYLEIYREAARS
jgi:starch synthase